jgi:hypothetical protein
MRQRCGAPQRSAGRRWTSIMPLLFAQPSPAEISWKYSTSGWFRQGGRTAVSIFALATGGRRSLPGVEYSTHAGGADRVNAAIMVSDLSYSGLFSLISGNGPLTSSTADGMLLGTFVHHGSRITTIAVESRSNRARLCWKAIRRGRRPPPEAYRCPPGKEVVEQRMVEPLERHIVRHPTYRGGEAR